MAGCGGGGCSDCSRWRVDLYETPEPVPPGSVDLSRVDLFKGRSVTVPATRKKHHYEKLILEVKNLPTEEARV